LQFVLHVIGKRARYELRYADISNPSLENRRLHYDSTADLLHELAPAEVVDKGPNFTWLEGATTHLLGNYQLRWRTGPQCAAESDKHAQALQLDDLSFFPLSIDPVFPKVSEGVRI